MRFAARALIMRRMEKPALSVVIVNYNARDLLRACLRSLAASVGVALEIIVVDNASRDGSAQMVQAEFPDVRLMALERNTWFCGGNNIGSAAASADTVLLLNPDTVVAPDALAQMVRFLAEHPDYVGVTAQLRYPDGGIQRTCSRVPTYAYLLANHTPLGWLFPLWRRRLNARHWYDGWARDEDYDVAAIPGSCTLMRKADIRLDDDLLLYFPEDDLAARHGGKCRFLAAAKIEHHEKSVTKTWLATRIYFRDMLVYTRKHHGWLAAGLLWGLSRPVLWGMWLRRALS